MNAIVANKPEMALTPAQIAQYESDGYLVIRGLFSGDHVAELRDAFMDLAANGRVEGMFDFNAERAEVDPLARFPRVMHPHRFAQYPVGRVAMKYLLDQRVKGVLTSLYGETPLAAQTMFYYKPPGARGQALHQDNFYLRVKPGTCMAAWVAVDSATEENGGLMVVPGSHRAEVACPAAADPSQSFTTEYVAPPDGASPVPVNLNAGDVLFFNGSVIHGSFPNQSETKFRRAFISHYIPNHSDESSEWYHPLISFEGEWIDGLTAATGGGPCGTPDTGGVH